MTYRFQPGMQELVDMLPQEAVEHPRLLDALEDVEGLPVDRPLAAHVVGQLQEWDRLAAFHAGDLVR